MKRCIHHLKGPKAFRIEMAVEVFPFKWGKYKLIDISANSRLRYFRLLTARVHSSIMSE